MAYDFNLIGSLENELSKFAVTNLSPDSLILWNDFRLSLAPRLYTTVGSVWGFDWIFGDEIADMDCIGWNGTVWIGLFGWEGRDVFAWLTWFLNLKKDFFLWKIFCKNLFGLRNVYKVWIFGCSFLVSDSKFGVE